MSQNVTDLLSDPLRAMLYDGPYSPIDVLEHLEDISTWVPEFEDARGEDDRYWSRFFGTYKVQCMLQSLEERDGILTPAWWTDTPQAFLKVFRENYAPNYRKQPYTGGMWTPADRQMQVLETVLYLWYLARDENESE